jgi:NarL family two-component system response regulator LiaR
MNQPARITVVVADDHVVLREGLVAHLRETPDIEVVGEASDAATACERVAATRPHIALLDIEMAGRDVFDAVRTMTTAQPELRVVFLSAHAHDSYIHKAVQASAWGFVTKSASAQTVCQAIRDVAHGWVHFSPEIQARIVNTTQGVGLSSVATRISLLTPRELEVLRHLAHGLSVKALARIMHISPKTADKHKTSLMNKLDIHDRVVLARFAFREGIARP